MCRHPDNCDRWLTRPRMRGALFLFSLTNETAQIRPQPLVDPASRSVRRPRSSAGASGIEPSASWRTALGDAQSLAQSPGLHCPPRRPAARQGAEHRPRGLRPQGPLCVCHGRRNDVCFKDGLRIGFRTDRSESGRRYIDLVHGLLSLAPQFRAHTSPLGFSHNPRSGSAFSSASTSSCAPDEGAPSRTNRHPPPLLPTLCRLPDRDLPSSSSVARR